MSSPSSPSDHAASAAAAATSSSSSLPSPASSSSSATPAAPRSFLERVIAPTGRQSTGMFRLMNPELFVERTKKVSPAAWFVTAMVGFVVVTIGYTQWEYTHTTKRVQEETAARKVALREERKNIIRQEMDREVKQSRQNKQIDK